MKKALGIASVVLAALSVAAVFGVHAYLDARRAAAGTAARIERLSRLGIQSDGTETFFPLPPSLPAEPGAVDLGRTLYRDRRLVAPTGRTCQSCHPLNAGGVDGRMHGGVLTRPVVNAGFAEMFLHDGSVTGLPALVERMIVDPSFGGATNLAYSVAWIGSDIKFSYRFNKHYPSGVTVSNVLDALTAYVKTRIAFNGPFDRFCAGQKDALSAEQARGFELFRRQRCDACHDGPLLGAWRMSEGRKVPALRGLSARNVYSAGGLRSDLGAVLPFMPGGDVESAAERLALVAFLGCL